MPNPIQTENALTGTRDWIIQTADLATAREIEGYWSDFAVDVGDNINLHVNCDGSWRLDLYRMGHYAGDGGRLMHSVAGQAAHVQTDPVESLPRHYVECAWGVSYTLAVPSNWVAGIYLAKLTREDTGKEVYAGTICVREPGHSAPVVYIQPVTTYHAYNEWAAGLGPWSLYGTERAHAVSFDRPYDASGVRSCGCGDFLITHSTFASSRGGWELDLIMYLESQGYDVAYLTDLDLHTGHALLDSGRIVISAGHDEYYSQEMRDRLEALRDGGTHLIFAGSNAVYFRVRFETSDGGGVRRKMICYKQDYGSDPGTPKTFLFRQLDTPEEELIGVMYNFSPGEVWAEAANVDHWAWSGSGAVPDQQFQGLVGYEWDAAFWDHDLTPSAAPPGTWTRLLYRDDMAGDAQWRYYDGGIYQAPSGAWVFASGTMNFSHALASNPWAVPSRRSNREDAAIQTMFSNILTAMGADQEVEMVEYQAGYSDDDGETWTTFADQVTEASGSLDTTGVPDGEVLLRARALNTATGEWSAWSDPVAATVQNGAAAVVSVPFLPSTAATYAPELAEGVLPDPALLSLPFLSSAAAVYAPVLAAGSGPVVYYTEVEIRIDRPCVGMVGLRRRLILLRDGAAHDPAGATTRQVTLVKPDGTQTVRSGADVQVTTDSEGRPCLQYVIGEGDFDEPGIYAEIGYLEDEAGVWPAEPSKFKVYPSGR